MQQINKNFIKLYHITHWSWSLLLRVWWLLKEPFFVWAYAMIKPSSLNDLLTGLTLPSLSRWTSLGRESPIPPQSVYNVDDGRSLQEKSIHDERENIMLFSSIREVNGRPFLRRSILWRQICRSDYRTLLEQQVFLQQMAPIHLCRHDSLEQLNITLQTNAWLLSYERIETFVVNNVRQVLLYVNSNEKWTGMKNTGLKMSEKDQIYVWVGFSYH